MLSWCQVQAKDQYFPLWNSDTRNQCRPSVPHSSGWWTGWCAGAPRHPPLRRRTRVGASGFIYHRARASLIPLAVLPWVTYLALPVSVNPLILLPSAALLSVAVRMHCGGDVQEVLLRQLPTAKHSRTTETKHPDRTAQVIHDVGHQALARRH